MSARNPAKTTGDPELDAALRDVVARMAPNANRDLIREIVTTVALLAKEDHDRLDLKITSAALAEMREAFGVFRPFRDSRKVTMFGSARTRSDDPLYAQARDLAALIAARDWMVVTGAGPGIMAAGMEGAGRDLSIGVNIRLPFEQGANPFIADDPKLVEMKYFFTRKLMLIKESDAYVTLPGGFGTLDETFELLTLLQTGKAMPAPVVLLDVPGGTYWSHWFEFVQAEVLGHGLIGAVDLGLFKITDSVQAAADEIFGFYRSYDSLRYVGDRLVLRLRVAPTAEQVQGLDETFGDILVPGRGGFEPVGPSAEERAEHDRIDLHRIAFPFDQLSLGRLRQLIDHLNALAGDEQDQATA
jgi:uncharacterized protein (TIGR00730 family)